MRTIFLFILLITTTLSHARSLRPLRLLGNNKGAVFNVENDVTVNSLIYVYSKDQNKKYKLSSVLKVLSCVLQECEAKYVKVRKGSSPSATDYYSLGPIGASNRPKGKQQMAYLAYGGPMAFGYTLGYFKQWNKDMRLGLKGGLIDAEISKVSISGQYVAVDAEYRWLGDDEYQLNPHGEIGYLKTTLDFSKVGGPETDESVPYVGLGVDGLVLWPDWFLISKVGYSYNFYKASYPGDGANYSAPFNGGLITIEVGAGLRF